MASCRGGGGGGGGEWEVSSETRALEAWNSSRASGSGRRVPRLPASPNRDRPRLVGPRMTIDAVSTDRWPRRPRVTKITVTPRALPQAPHVVIELLAGWISSSAATNGLVHQKSSFGPVISARAMETRILHAARQFARIGARRNSASPTMRAPSISRSREACLDWPLSRSGR